MYEDQIARGAALLDEREPGWEDGIDLSVLDIADPRRCVVGQLCGAFVTGLMRLGIEPLGGAVEHGFAAKREEYPALTEEWRGVIEARRAAAASN